MHDLVGNDVGRHERHAVGPLAEPHLPGSLRPEGRRDPECVGEVEADVHHAHEPAVPAVHAVPALLEREVVVGEARVGVGVDHRRIGPVVVGVARHVARPPDARRVLDEEVRPVLVVAHVEGDRLGGTQPVVRPILPAGLGGAQLLALTLNAGPDAHRRGLLDHVALRVHDPPAVRVEIVRLPVGHRHPPREDVGTEKSGKDDEGRRLDARRPCARLLRDQGQRIVAGHQRRRVDVDPLVEGAEDRDGHAAGELPGYPAADDRDALVVLPEALVNALRQVTVGHPGREDELVVPLQRVDQLVGTAQLRQPGFGRPDLAAADRLLSRHADKGNGKRRSGNESPDRVLSHLHRHSGKLYGESRRPLTLADPLFLWWPAGTALTSASGNHNRFGRWVLRSGQKRRVRREPVVAMATFVRHATLELLQSQSSFLEVAVFSVPLLPTSSPLAHPGVPFIVRPSACGGRLLVLHRC